MEEIDLNPTDNSILDVLHGGRCTPAFIAAEEDYTRGNVKNRLDRLEEHGYVTKVHRGLYELADDPRDEDQTEHQPTEFVARDNMKSVSYGPWEDREGYVLSVVTEEAGKVTIAFPEDAMYALWTEVQHTPWPETLDEQDEAGRLRQKLIDLSSGADAEMLRDALEGLDPHWEER